MAVRYGTDAGEPIIGTAGDDRVAGLGGAGQEVVVLFGVTAADFGIV
ncbi:hypothetical protein [Benzoatithermus flavus]|uniref:Uncharacterized protein n=1 Tax=Benzoatithermus flavus TaxID=3108223 RepID=A0ABU8XSR1_9PROT